MQVNVLPKPGELKDYPGNMSIGGNSIWQQCHLDSQFYKSGKASGSGKSQVVRYPEWSGNTYLERGKKSAVNISLGYVPLGSEMSSMLLQSSMEGTLFVFCVWVCYGLLQGKLQWMLSRRSGMSGHRYGLS